MTTPKLQMPELVVGQAGKELTHNQALAVLDQLAQAVVVDKDLTAPPGSPANGSMYIVAAGATGAWSGQSGKLAYWLTTVAAWTFITPADGWSAWVTDEAVRYERKAGAWVEQSGGGAGMTNPMTTAGDLIVGAAAGAPNRLPVGASGKVLGVAAGLPAWVDPPTSGTSQGTNLAINGAFQVNQLNQSATSGTVTLAAGGYGWQSSTDKGFDQWKGGASGCTYTFSTTANVTTITITAGSLQQVIEGKNLQSGTHALSWSGTAQGKIGAGSYSGSGITGPATGGTNLTIEFNAGTLSNVKFEPGSTPTAHALPLFSKTLSDCRRYLPAFVAIGTGVQYIATAYAFSTSQISVGYQFDVFPRVPPTGIALSSVSAFNINASGGGAGPATAISFSSASSKAGRILATAPGAITAGGGAEFFAIGTDGAWLVFTGAEL